MNPNNQSTSKITRIVHSIASLLFVVNLQFLVDGTIYPGSNDYASSALTGTDKETLGKANLSLGRVHWNGALPLSKASVICANLVQQVFTVGA